MYDREGSSPFSRTRKREFKHGKKLHCSSFKKVAATVYPFVDGNGRIPGLLMNTALRQDGYMLAVISPVLRHEDISQLERVHRDVRAFMDFITERVIESEKEIVRRLHIPFLTIGQMQKTVHLRRFFNWAKHPDSVVRRPFFGCPVLVSSVAIDPANIIPEAEISQEQKK